MIRPIAQLYLELEVWGRMIKLWFRLQFNRWAQREQDPMHADRPALILAISQIEWELRDLGFGFLV